MAKGNAIVMYLEQARIHGEPIGVTHSEVLFTKPNGYTVQPHNRVVSKADNKTMNSTPFVRQYGILSNKWGVLLCQKEYQTNDIRQNSKSW